MDTINIQNTRGSEWRKWDLHIHTKGTSKNDQFTSADFNAFCVALFKKAIEKDIKAIGITDYFSIDNYKQVVNFQENIKTNTSFTDEEKGRISKIFILPNVELRMLPVTDIGRLINIHCIFNPAFVLNLDNDFFSTLKYVGGNQDYLMNKQGIVALGKSLDNTITDENIAYKKGIENFVVSHENLKKLLANNSNLRENTIIVVSNSSNDGASAIQKHYDLFENENGSLDGIRKTIYEISDCIFSSNEKDVKFFAGKEDAHTPEIIKQKCGSLKPCIHGSDAHSEDKLFNPDNNRFCWIKADLTFNGLKQILYEPDERVKIQETKPDEKNVYQVIDSIVLDESNFWKNTIYFNENLNTIIGGRSTGKSTLLKSIARKIDGTISDENFITDHLSGITVKWKDGEETASRDIDFFPQSYMHDIAKDNKETNALIEGIIKNTDKNKILSSQQTENENIKRNITTWILDLFETNTKCVSLQTQLKESGDKKGVEAEIIRLGEKLTELNKHCTIQQTEIDAFNDSSHTIQSNNQNISQYENDLQIFSSLKNKSIISENYLYELYQLSDTSKSEITSKFQELKNEVDAVWNKQIDSIISSTNQNIEISKKSISDVQQSEIYKKGVKYYSDNKELSDIQKKLSDEKIKLQSIETLEKQIIALTNQKDATLNNIVLEHIKYKQEIEKVVSNLQIEYDNLEITLNISFKKIKLKEFIESRLSQRGYERQGFINTFIENFDTDTENQLKSFLTKSLNNEIEYKNGNNNQNVVNELLTANWYSLNYELKYQNDIFSIMSEGKQAFVVLKLLLDFSTKKCPILIDQPEDSLDNRAIYNELVQYLRAKKKERQIILVTHNPNVVVSADAENVIVANQDGENSKNQDDIKFQYINGALENTKTKDTTIDIVLESQGIREHACEILEGGKEASEKREQKYGFKK